MKKKIKNDGIICFGGKYEDETLNNELLLFKFNNISNDRNFDKILTNNILSKNWDVIKTEGIRP